MSELVDNCSRCGANHVTFDFLAATPADIGGAHWQYGFEAFCPCRRCLKKTVFEILLHQYEAVERFRQPNSLHGDFSLNLFFRVVGYVSIAHRVSINPPDHVPQDVQKIFVEGTRCLAIGCWNASSTMFRLYLDKATLPLLPELDDTDATPSRRQARDLGLRIPWLIDHGFLPAELKALAQAVREDGNDGAHSGNLLEADANDLCDFTVILLERMFTEPGRLEAAQLRRSERRAT